MVCKFHDQEWAEFDKDGYVVNSPWYQPPRKEKITMHTQSFDYVTYLINDRHNKNFNHYNDLVFLQLKDDNLYPVTTETVEQYGKVSDTQLQTYMNFLLFKELKARYVYDECIKRLLLSGIEKSK